MGRMKFVLTAVLVVVLVLAAVFGFAALHRVSGVSSEPPVLVGGYEYETGASTFLEVEILGWRREAPIAIEMAAVSAPDKVEPPARKPAAETQNQTRAPEPEPEALRLKVLVPTTDPPPTEPKPALVAPEPTSPPALANYGEADKVLVLSFDDGPGPHTERLLDILAQNKVKATFFVVGYKTDRYKETIKRMAKEGHQVAGHSWNHPKLTAIGGETIKTELRSTNDAIYEITGIRPTFYRAPYGAYNDNVKKISKELGLSLIQWNIDVGDWKYRNADTVYRNIMSMVKDGCVICVHDVHLSTVDAIERAIPDLIASGYKFLTVSEMFGTMEPGLVYYNRGYAK